MNPRHTAALALLGWALILPPMVGDQVDLGAPVNDWTVGARGFATEHECEQYRPQCTFFGYVNLSDDSAKSQLRIQAEMSDFAQRRDASRCTPDDDPRIRDQKACACGGPIRIVHGETVFSRNMCQPAK